MPLHPPKVTFSQRRPLLERLAVWRAHHDPGGVDMARAVHLALCFLIVIGTGSLTAALFVPAMAITFPLMAGAGVLAMISFTPGASRLAEARSMARVFSVALVFLLVLALIGPGSGATNELLQKLLLIPLSVIALLLRRWGMSGQRLGLSLIMVATVGTVLQPTHQEALWLMAAFCQGALVAALIRLSPWRPSAVDAYLDSTHNMQAAVAAYLREMSESVREGRPFPDTAALPVEALRGQVWAALANAIAEAPQAQDTFEALRAKLYRLRVAVELLAGCVPDTPGAEQLPILGDRNTSPTSWRRPFASATDYLARRLEDLDRHDLPGQERFARALERLRESAFCPDLPAETRFALLRALTAFERLVLVVDAISAMQNRRFLFATDNRSGRTPLEPTPLLITGADGRRTLSDPLKVAIQGLVATSFTTGLDFIFGLDHAYWATMTVMFVLGNSVGETYMRVRYRTLGTLVGVLLGMAVFLSLGEYVWLLAGACMAAQTIAIITQKDRYDVASAAVGFSVVLGLYLISGLGPEGMLARIYETIIGAAVALAVSFLVLPVYLTDQLRPELHNILKRGQDIFATWWPRRGQPEPVGPLAQMVRGFDLSLPTLGAENIFGHSAGDVVNLISTLDVVVTYLALLEDTAHRLSDADVKEEVLPVVEAARSRTLTALELASAAALEEPLHDAAQGGAAAAAPALDAAISTALSMADDPSVKASLPLVADYLAYSDALMRPLRELRVSLRDQTPWKREHTINADRPARRH